LRTITEIDVAAFRLPEGDIDYAPDPALRVPRNKPDMIIGEVKEGRAVINESATDPDVIAKVLRRFGFATDADARHVARTLLANGSAETRGGQRVRLVAFGSSSDEPSSYLKILLSDVVAYVDRYIAENWEVVRAAGSRDPIFGVMVLLAKARGSLR
jgi:hypothetical protein